MVHINIQPSQTLGVFFDRALIQQSMMDTRRGKGSVLYFREAHNRGVCRVSRTSEGTSTNAVNNQKKMFFGETMKEFSLVMNML